LCLEVSKFVNFLPFLLFGLNYKKAPGEEKKYSIFLGEILSTIQVQLFFAQVPVSVHPSIDLFFNISVTKNINLLQFIAGRRRDFVRQSFIQGQFSAANASRPPFQIFLLVLLACPNKNEKSPTHCISSCKGIEKRSHLLLSL
jgi:hypothetical protein